MNFLPGWDIPVGAIAKSDILLTLIANDTASPHITLPSGIEAGDLIIVAVSAQASSEDNPNTTDPAGFTKILEIAGEAGGLRAARMHIYYKIAAGNEDNTQLQIQTDPDDARASFYQVWRPSQPIGTVTALGATGDLTQGDPDERVISNAPPWTLALALYMGANTGVVNIGSRSFSPTEDDEMLQSDTAGTLAVSMAFKWKRFFPPDTAQNVTINMGDTGVSSVIGCVALRVTQ